MSVRRVRLMYWFVDCLPKWLVFWCAMRLWVAGTTGEYNNTIAPELTIDEAIRRWESKGEKR